MNRKVDLYAYEFVNFCCGRRKIYRKVDFHAQGMTNVSNDEQNS